MTVYLSDPCLQPDDENSPRIWGRTGGLYTAPEAQNGVYIKASDIFSLGCVFLEVLTSLGGDRLEQMRALQNQDSLKEVQDMRWPAIWSSYLRSIFIDDGRLNALLRLCEMMLSKEPNLRPAAREVVQHLHHIHEGHISGDIAMERMYTRSCSPASSSKIPDNITTATPSTPDTVWDIEKERRLDIKPTGKNPFEHLSSDIIFLPQGGFRLVGISYKKEDFLLKDSTTLPKSNNGIESDKANEKSQSQLQADSAVGLVPSAAKEESVEDSKLRSSSDSDQAAMSSAPYQSHPSSLRCSQNDEMKSAPQKPPINYQKPHVTDEQTKSEPQKLHSLTVAACSLWQNMHSDLSPSNQMLLAFSCAFDEPVLAIRCWFQKQVGSNKGTPSPSTKSSVAAFGAICTLWQLKNLPRNPTREVQLHLSVAFGVIHKQISDWLEQNRPKLSPASSTFRIKPSGGGCRGSSRYLEHLPPTSHPMLSGLSSGRQPSDHGSSNTSPQSRIQASHHEISLPRTKSSNDKHVKNSDPLSLETNKSWMSSLFKQGHSAQAKMEMQH